jgi:hypothetical protein
MRISRRWSTRLSLLKTRSKRWRRMEEENMILETVFGKQHLTTLASVRAFLQKPEYGSPVDAWTTSSIPYGTIKLSSVAPKHPDAEASPTDSSTQCVATVSLERTARPSPNRSNLLQCTSQGSHNGIACFNCGLIGDLAWQCPTRQAVPGVRN